MFYYIYQQNVTLSLSKCYFKRLFMNPIIRFVEKEDINQLIDLCEAHSLYEKCIYNREGKREGLLNDLFSKTPKLY